MKVRIYYEDTDSGGVVYYANYLRYFERARTEFLREKGCEVSDFIQSGFLFVVTKVNVSYHYPARYNDVLKIETRMGDIRSASFVFSHKVYLNGSDHLVVDAQVKLACVDGRGRPTRLPERLDKSLKEAP